MARRRDRSKENDPLHFSNATERFEESVAKVLQDYPEIMRPDLTEAQRRAIVQGLAYEVVQGRQVGPDNPVLSSLYMMDYRQRPVDIDTFLMSEEYLGSMVGESLRPCWRRDLNKIFAPTSPVFLWILTGCIGGGKTFAAMLAMCYKIYRLSCLADPWKFYGIAQNTPIVFGCYSITKSQAADTGYTYLKNFIDGCPYFTNYFPRNPKIDSRIDFGPTTGKNISVISGSRSLHVIGQNLFSICIDEVNFMQSAVAKETGEQTGQAYKLYGDVESRMVSRFLNKYGTMPGIMLLVSSKNSQSSFLEEKIKTADKVRTHISDYALWEAVEKHAQTKKWFFVEVGDKMSESRVVPDTDTPKPGMHVVKVPETFRKYFERNPDQALREIAGVATMNVSPLIRDKASVYRAVKDYLVHPFTRQTITLSMVGGEKDLQGIEDYVDIRRIMRPENSAWRPLRNPRARRYIHGDLALTQDAAGLAMGHVAGLRRVQVPHADGTTSVEVYPLVEIDFMLRIVPPTTGQIPLFKIRRFIYWLRSLYPLGSVTFDGFQSADMIQQLQYSGVDARRLSVDESAAPYEALRLALLEDRLHYYKYEPFEREILDAQYDVLKGKVDHPEKGADGAPGSKDVADCVAGVVWSALSDTEARVAIQDEYARTGTEIPAPGETPPMPVPMTQKPKQAPPVQRVGGVMVDWNLVRKLKETNK